MPVARNLDTEFGWQRDDLASALRYQEQINIPDVATAIYDEGGAESNSDLGTHAGCRQRDDTGTCRCARCLEDTTWVHFAECEKLKTAKRNMLYAFMKAVAPASRALVCDPDLPLPYANLEIVDSAGRRRIKRHHIKGVKARR